MLVISTPGTFYVLKFKRDAYMEHAEKGDKSGDEGFEDAFDFCTEISEDVVTGDWIGDCFIYTTATNRLNYLVGESFSTISHFDM